MLNSKIKPENRGPEDLKSKTLQSKTKPGYTKPEDFKHESLKPEDFESECRTRLPLRSKSLNPKPLNKPEHPNAKPKTLKLFPNIPKPEISHPPKP